MSGSSLQTFYDYVLDENGCQLRRGNEPVHLTPKALRLLEVLIRAAPNAVSKAELYDQVWGESFVEEANLPNLVSEIRSALGDSRDSPRYIRTVHGHGYAFIAPVTTARETLGASWYLVWKKRRFNLVPGENVVGREETCDVVIESAAVSRRHAVIRVERERVVIRDLASKNGTFLEGSAVQGETVVRPDDEIGFGTVRVRLRVARGADTTVTEAGDA